ncbi:hypothetical protein J6590_020098 [Homalodisca vitripennis]|nr:hypothetical protein J6590_020098 [Homalodisca vitripennis]
MELTQIKLNQMMRRVDFPPSFKTSTPSTRTHNKQLLMKEKALEDSRREQLEQQRRNQQRQAEIKTQEKQTHQFLRVPQNVGVHVDLPPQVLQVNKYCF